ncbi:MAG: alpha/beta fold hydrolase [Acidobacteriota bacterium]
MISNNFSLTHLVRKPQTSTQKPPLLLLLHGIGSNEDDLFGLAPYLDGRFLVISARAPYTMMPGMYAWFNIEFTPSGIIPDLDQAEASRRLVIEFIDQMVEAYDAGPVYLMGFSQGAMMSLAVALTRPDKVSRVVAMSGRVPQRVIESAASTEALSRLEVFMTHGIYDEVIPVENGRACRDELERLSVKVTYREYPMAHQVSMESLSDITSWLEASLDRSR